MLVACTNVNGVIHSTSFYLPYDKNEITITIKHLTIPQLGSVALDYKTISCVGKYTYELTSSVANANGNDMVSGNIVAVLMDISYNT